jgi:hypothetical protein
LAPAQTTLAEILHARGFRTGAFVGSVVLDADRGLAQGFEQYGGVAREELTPRRSRGQRRADAVIDDAMHCLKTRYFLRQPQQGLLLESLDRDGDRRLRGPPGRSRAVHRSQKPLPCLIMNERAAPARIVLIKWNATEG